MANLRAAKATDVYICSGDPHGETYTPRFTQHGFRYVEVTGLAYILNETEIEAVELHTDVQHACVWSQKSNLMGLPTDCPQRDERRGWMGDAALAAELAVYNFGMGAIYSRWLLQIADAAHDDGSVPNFVPSLIT